jgi:hypothetical protein
MVIPIEHLPVAPGQNVDEINTAMTGTVVSRPDDGGAKTDYLLRILFQRRGRRLNLRG